MSVLGTQEELTDIYTHRIIVPKKILRYFVSLEMKL